MSNRVTNTICQKIMQIVNKKLYQTYWEENFKVEGTIIFQIYPLETFITIYCMSNWTIVYIGITVFGECLSPC